MCDDDHYAAVDPAAESCVGAPTPAACWLTKNSCSVFHAWTAAVDSQDRALVAGGGKEERSRAEA